MPRELRYTDDALADLEAIKRWLTQPGAGAKARKKLIAIFEAIERLREYPAAGPVLDHPGVRELPCPGGYRALYEIVPDTSSGKGDVLVLKIYGSGQHRTGL